MNKLILMRHGQSEWNRLNLFTGWVDVSLSATGIEEALAGGERIKDFPIDIIFTTSLIRAQMTALLAMSRHSSKKTPVILHPASSKLEEWGEIYSPSTKEACIPVFCAWELNERMYGELQGLNKAETAERFGAEQVKRWRRSFDIPPPHGESLKMTAARSIPYFEKNILPCLEEGKNVLVSAHGNSLRAIMMYLDKLSSEEVLNLEIATGEPIFYQFREGKIVRE